MDNYQLLMFARIVACQVEALALTAENQQRAHKGQTMAYGEDAFIDIMANLRAIVDQLR